MNTREKVLKEALKCVNGEREKQYGNPEDNFSRIADLWSVYLTSLFEDEKIVIDIDPIDVAKMMILFKIARSNGDKDKLDNYVDMIGYGACAAEIFESIENKDRNEIIAKRFGIPIEKLDESEETYQYFMKKNFDEKSENDPKKFSDKELRKGLAPIENIGDIKIADECKDCNYAKKCMGTGICLKEKEKELIKGCYAKKDKPDAFEKLVRESYGEGAHLDCEHCKYEPTDEQDYPCKKCTPNKNGGTLFESDARQKIKKVEPAEECRTCDAYKKCAGTGHCYKKEREELSNLSDGEFEALWAERMRKLGGNAEAKCMHEQVEGNPFHIFIVGDCDELTKEEKDKITKKFEDFINAFIDDKKKNFRR